MLFRSFQPFPLLAFVTPTPVMLTWGVEDRISPTEMQRELIWERLSDPKYLVEVQGKAHMNLVSGQGSDEVLDEQVRWLEGVWNKK